MMILCKSLICFLVAIQTCLLMVTTHCIINRSIAMWMIFTKTVTDNSGRLSVRLVWCNSKLHHSMTPLAMELMRDLEKDTVRWSLNFDDSLKEPDMLPGRFPNLLINGAYGIAVGVATNIPPHNVGETFGSSYNNLSLILSIIGNYFKQAHKFWLTVQGGH